MYKFSLIPVGLRVNTTYSTGLMNEYNLINLIHAWIPSYKAFWFRNEYKPVMGQCEALEAGTAAAALIFKAAEGVGEAVWWKPKAAEGEAVSSLPGGQRSAGRKEREVEFLLCHTSLIQTKSWMNNTKFILIPEGIPNSFRFNLN